MPLRPLPTPVVLIHGGGLDRRCWDRLLPHLDGPGLAVDLPGRGAHPAPLDTVSFPQCAASVREDIDGAGFGEVVLVGHSLAGCSMPTIIGALGERVRHAVFVACTVPEDGHSAFDTLDPEIQAMARSSSVSAEPRPMDPAMARVVLGPDLDDGQFAWCSERLVPEATRLSTDPVDLSALRTAMPRTWVRTLRDAIIPADKQLRFVDNVGDCQVQDLDAGHMCMVSEPSKLAAMINAVAAGR